MTPVSRHTLSRFDNELVTLDDLILSMFKLTQHNIKGALKAIYSGDEALVDKVTAQDEAVNALEVQIDELARRLIVTHQPAASDLRRVFAATKIVTDLERISDLAIDIAGEVARLGGSGATRVGQLKVMQKLVMTQIKAVRKAYFERDVEAAHQVIEQDGVVNDAYESCQRVMLTLMLESTKQITSYLALSNVAAGLERIGDHITNIAEMIIYMVIGHEVRHVSPERIQELIQEQDDDD